MSIGSVRCPGCGCGIRATFASAPGRLSIVIDKRDVSRHHAACFTPTNGGERVSA